MLHSNEKGFLCYPLLPNTRKFFILNTSTLLHAHSLTVSHHHCLLHISIIVEVSWALVTSNLSTHQLPPPLKVPTNFASFRWVTPAKCSISSPNLCEHSLQLYCLSESFSWNHHFYPQLTARSTHFHTALNPSQIQHRDCVPSLNCCGHTPASPSSSAPLQSLIKHTTIPGHGRNRCLLKPFFVTDSHSFASPLLHFCSSGLHTIAMYAIISIRCKKKRIRTCPNYLLVPLFVQATY